MFELNEGAGDVTLMAGGRTALTVYLRTSTKENINDQVRPSRR
jgi:hypothetical protein